MLRINVHHYHHFDGDGELLARLEQLAASVLELKGIIIMNQEQAVAYVGEIKAVLDKVGAEIEASTAANTALQESVAALQIQLANAGNIGPELQAAFEDLKAKADDLDAKQPDLPVLPDAPV